MFEHLNLLPWQEANAEFTSKEEYLARAIAASDEGLAVEGEFSIHYNVADDPLYRITIIKFSRFTSGRHALNIPEECLCQMFDRFEEVVTVDQIESKLRQAINNMHLYIDATYLLRSRLSYFDPSQPERICFNPQCNRPFTGPAVYCCFNCALGDR